MSPLATKMTIIKSGPDFVTAPGYIREGDLKQINRPSEIAR